VIRLQKPSLLSSGLVLVLAGIALTRAEAQTKLQAQVPTTPPVGLTNPLAAYPLDRLSATRERPLFSPSRRPPAPPPAPIISRPSPPAPPNVRLFGIVMDADEARAIVQTGPANNIRRVRIGDDIGGWKVSQIERRRLVLSLDNRLATFTMFRGHGKPAPELADEQRQVLPQQTPVNRDRRGY
jgi:hypothetical protein